jgi:hypothetical protein
MTISFGVIFLLLFFRSLLREKFFPLSGLGELKATNQLIESTREIERKILIDGYIDDAIKSLNENTCNYNNVNVENHLCDQSVSLGLKSVCLPYVENPQNLLNTSKAKFAVGAYLNYFLKIAPSEAPGVPHLLEEKDLLVLRDDFGFDQFLSKEILTDPNLVDTAFNFQTQFRYTFNHAAFAHSPLHAGGKDYSIITAPIPTVCEDGPQGVFYIICEKLNSIPSDLENVTFIFCRLFTNWLSRYNDCMANKYDVMIDALTKKTIPVAEPQEVTAQKVKETNGTPIAKTE